MMQAAQAAAAAAMAEAMARETEINSGGGERSREMDMDASDSMINNDQLAFLHALQGSDMGDQARILGDINMMGLDPNDGEVQNLLQMLSQQQQQQQEQENQRQDEHYLTIAQNGRFLLERKEGR
jgi:hypothetical protein